MEIKTDNNQNIDKTKLVQKASWIGFGLNLFLATIKFIVGILGNSQAVIADAVHSLSDLSTDIAVIMGVKFWTAPADENHPYGHKRIEAIVTTFIGIILILVAFEIGRNSILTIKEPHTKTPHWIALTGSIFSIFSKEILYRWTKKIAIRTRSSALMANAWHHRSDAISSIPPLVAVGLVLYNPELAFVDHIGALIVSIFILKVAWDILKPAFCELTDCGASETELEDIYNIARSVEGVQSAHAIRTRLHGAGKHVDLHIHVDAEMSVFDGHEISEQVKRELLEKGPNILDVVVHLEPAKKK